MVSVNCHHGCHFVPVSSVADSGAEELCEVGLDRMKQLRAFPLLEKAEVPLESCQDALFEGRLE